MKRKLKDTTEASLIEMINSGNIEQANQAFNEIYKRNYRIVSHYITKRGLEDGAVEKDDLIQQVFTKAFKSIHGFQPEYRMSTWIIKIAKNISTDIYRANATRLKTMIPVNIMTTDEDGNESTMEFSDNSDNPEDIFENDERNAIIHKLVDNKLKGNYKKVVEMFFFEQKSYDEIAEELDMPLGTIKNKMFRAKELLKSAMSKSFVLA